MDNKTGICNADNLAFSKEIESKFYAILDEYVSEDMTYHDISVMCSALLRVCSLFLCANGVPLETATKLIQFCYSNYQSMDQEAQEEDDK